MNTGHFIPSISSWGALFRQSAAVVLVLLCTVSSLSAQTTFTYSLNGISTDIFYTACEAENGDFLISGMTRSFPGDGTQSFYVVRLDSLGEVVWEQFYGGFSDEFGGRIVPRKEGGFLIAGSTYSYGEGFDDIYFVAIDDSGVVEWEKTIGDSITQNISDLVATPDGGFAVVGKWAVNDSVLGQAFILKIDDNGEELFRKFFGGYYFDQGLSLIVMEDNQYMLGNRLSVYNDSLSQWENRIQLLGLDGAGEVLWADTIQHPNPQFSAFGGRAREIIQLSDSTYLVLGDMAVNVDRYGNILSVSAIPRANAAVPGPNLEFLVGLEGYLIYYNIEGDTLWEENPEIFVQSILATRDGGYLVVGDKDLDMLAIKVNCRGTMEAHADFCNVPEPPVELAIQFWPNPVSQELNLSIIGLEMEEEVEIEIFDLQGRRVMAIEGLFNQESLIPTAGLSNGLYIMRTYVDGALFKWDRLTVLH